MLHIQKGSVGSSLYKKKISRFIAQEQSHACVMPGFLVTITYTRAFQTIAEMVV